VLHNISLAVHKNEHVAIVGENGAGKSTLIKLISGLYAPTNGDITVDDQSLEAINVAEWHRRIAVLSQDFIDYGFATARDNVLFGDVQKHDNALYHESLKAAEADEFIKKLPYGDTTYMDSWMESDGGEKGVRVSGGQWQRIALARNFYRDAPIIILDEPTSAIDALAESRIFERLFKRKDKTIITISHRLTTVKKADVIYMMKDGRIVEQGTCDELLNKKGEFYEMFKAQL
jgi:ATP-binding cassette subfamily B protein/ATP-binding cassette subfamily C protein